MRACVSRSKLDLESFGIYFQSRSRTESRVLYRIFLFSLSLSLSLSPPFLYVIIHASMKRSAVRRGAMRYSVRDEASEKSASRWCKCRGAICPRDSHYCCNISETSNERGTRGSRRRIMRWHYDETEEACVSVIRAPSLSLKGLSPRLTRSDRGV